MSLILYMSKLKKDDGQVYMSEKIRTTVVNNNDFNNDLFSIVNNSLLNIDVIISYNKLYNIIFKMI